MDRDLKKRPFVDEHLTKKVEAQVRVEGKRVIKTWSRHSTVFPSSVEYTIVIYGGREHASVHIQEDMVGYKSGEFAPIRTYRGHAADDRRTKHWFEGRINPNGRTNHIS